MMRIGTAVAALAMCVIASCGGSEQAVPESTGDSSATSPTSTASITPTLPSVTSTTAVTPAPPTTTTTVNPATSIPSTPVPTTVPSVPDAPTIRSIIDGGEVQNLAHAGGDQAAPHSTMFAFIEAVRAGATMLELDVQLTADGALVVQHDDTVDKTTEATGPVADLTLADIQALDNAYWFSPECWPCHDRPVDEYVYRGVRTGTTPPPNGYIADDFMVPTFRQVATSFPTLPLDIEIKGSMPGAVQVAETLAAELRELDREDSTVVVSFDDQVVDAFHELAPEVAVSPGLGRLTAWFLDGTELEPHFEILQLPPFQGEIEVVTSELVERIHAEGRVVWVWPDDAATHENADFYGSLVDLGVDGVIAGRPSVMSAVLAAR